LPWLLVCGGSLSSVFHKVLGCVANWQGHLNFFAEILAAPKFWQVRFITLSQYYLQMKYPQFRTKGVRTLIAKPCPPTSLQTSPQSSLECLAAIQMKIRSCPKLTRHRYQRWGCAVAAAAACPMALGAASLQLTTWPMPSQMGTAQAHLLGGKGEASIEVLLFQAVAPVILDEG